MLPSCCCFHSLSLMIMKAIGAVKSLSENILKKPLHAAMKKMRVVKANAAKAAVSQHPSPKHPCCNLRIWHDCELRLSFTVRAPADPPWCVWACGVQTTLFECLIYPVEPRDWISFTCVDDQMITDGSSDDWSDRLVDSSSFCWLIND